MSHGEIVSYKNLCNLKDHKAKTDSFPLLQGKPRQENFIIFRICLEQIQLDFQSIGFKAGLCFQIKQTCLTLKITDLI